jgi:hypothetical protein
MRLWPTPVRGLATQVLRPAGCGWAAQAPHGAGPSQEGRTDATPATWRRAQAVPAPQPQARQPHPQPIRLSEEDARDVAQFAWLKFVEKQPARTNVFGWLYTTAKHEVFARKR